MNRAHLNMLLMMLISSNAKDLVYESSSDSLNSFDDDWFEKPKKAKVTLAIISDKQLKKKQRRQAAWDSFKEKS